MTRKSEPKTWVIEILKIKITKKKMQFTKYNKYLKNLKL